MRKGILLGLSILLFAGPLLAEGLVDPKDMPGPLKEVRFDQHLGADLPLDATFLDEEGKSVKLGDYFGERPVIVTFVYYRCPMLCSLILNGLAKSLGVLSIDVGKDFDVVAISFNPEEGPDEAVPVKESTVKRYGRAQTAPGWHFLSGTEASIRRVTETAGFAYVYVEESGEYAHASGIVIATPEGKIAQYYYGIEYPPKDVRLALVEASSNQIGSIVDQLLLYCFHYNPTLGRYTAITMRLVRIGGVLVTLIMVSFMVIMWLRERRKAGDVPPQSPQGDAGDVPPRSPQGDAGSVPPRSPQGDGVSAQGAA